MTTAAILQHLPYAAPFLFVDELIDIDEEKVTGRYTFQPDMPCYQGHFKGHPVTPGVLLTEVMAQIGVVCLGIYLLRDSIKQQFPTVAMTSTQVDFYLPVFPGETVEVKAEKIYFRFNKLKCRVSLYNAAGKLVCDGVIAGMIIYPQHA
ncbi:3-hydroxyacyl-[acyl-carrier-protein] dehydratase [Chitinophaga polysaccharea]|uniref:3-hydroxyacyl-[acyl-carrier-protein] dehydratase n=1 Tax=Chitinophaga polysaccharea TaxID=1293035 RepID=A0A561PU41_9BACT|nr:FabA/FabZ family ACP-dehydratase [Chitinophaga polysaccharea]TWF41634.1 3-hydroxyacyl-[acyl-carrier-protein] dehydratase [Chitinophaga polysaccharea]